MPFWVEMQSKLNSCLLHSLTQEMIFAAAGTAACCIGSGSRISYVWTSYEHCLYKSEVLAECCSITLLYVQYRHSELRVITTGFTNLVGTQLQLV